MGMTDNEITKDLDFDIEPHRDVMKVLQSYKALCINVQIAKNKVDMIDKALSVLEPEELKIVRYMCMESVEGAAEDLSFELDISRSDVYRKRRKALDKLSVALYGCDIH